MPKNMTETARLLVVARESSILRPLWSAAEPNAWQIESAVNAWDAIERIQSGAVPHLLLLDLPRGDGDNLHLLRWLRRLRPDLPVIVTCFAEEAAKQTEATRLGAQEVLVRPFDEATLETTIMRHLNSTVDGTEIVSENIEQLGPDCFFVSASPVTEKLRAQAELLAEADVPVLILGEAGSGKDTVARLIHKHSVRSGFNFLKVNCADMPGDLLDAELFGSERNIFSNGRNGVAKFERAERGTLFLDEIAEMPLELQCKLVQVLQDKVVFQRGGEKPRAVDVRILASTSAPMDRALAERKLREDLYYRLSAFTVQVPPLRQRRSEIPALLQHSMHQVARHYSLPAREFPANVLESCQRYEWPGNLDELENFVKRYLVAGEREFAFNAGNSNGGGVAGSSRANGAIGPPTARQNFGAEEKLGPRSLKSLIDSVKCEAERNAIGSALQKTGWNRKAAARLLQVSYRTLLYKIDQYHMTASESFMAPLPGNKFSLNGGLSKTNGKSS